MDQQLTQRMKSLRLSGMASTMEVRNTEAIAASLSHLEFLELLVEDELGIRADRPTQKTPQAGPLPGPQKPWRTLTLPTIPPSTKGRSWIWQPPRFVASAKGILLQGPSRHR